MVVVLLVVIVLLMVVMFLMVFMIVMVFMVVVLLMVIVFVVMVIVLLMVIMFFMMVMLLSSYCYTSLSHLSSTHLLVIVVVLVMLFVVIVLVMIVVLIMFLVLLVIIMMVSGRDNDSGDGNKEQHDVKSWLLNSQRAYQRITRNRFTYHFCNRHQALCPLPLILCLLLPDTYFILSPDLAPDVSKRSFHLCPVNSFHNRMYFRSSQQKNRITTVITLFN